MTRPINTDSSSEDSENIRQLCQRLTHDLIDPDIDELYNASIQDALDRPYEYVSHGTHIVHI